MNKTDEMPLWVYLAFSSISSRSRALFLIWSCVIFTFYCIPWVTFGQPSEWVVKLFLIDDWSWFAMMLPMSIWYWLSLKWVDKYGEW